jgi:cytochrome c5
MRCGLEEVRLAGEDARPLVEAHHLSYGDAETTDDAAATTDATTMNDAAAAGPHEITVALCRWCHTKVHRSIARIDDDASPDPEAIAEREGRRTREREETAFETARERFDESE